MTVRFGALSCLLGAAVSVSCQQSHPQLGVTWCDQITYEVTDHHCSEGPGEAGRSENVLTGAQTVVRIHFDSAGRVMARTWNGDGRRLERRHYDGTGRLVSLERELDGELQSRWTFEYDERGVRTGQLVDSDADGDADAVVRFDDRFEGGSHLRAVEIDGRAVVDAACWVFEPAPIDGIVDTRHLWVFDADERPLRRESDLEADGVLDEILSFQYEGQRLVQTILERRTELPDVVTDYEYDRQGRLTQVRGISDDGVEWQERFEYADDWPSDESCPYFALARGDDP